MKDELFARIDVLLYDPMRQEPEYLGEWHIFLPSHLMLDCVDLGVPLQLRIHAQWNYDQNIFTKRFIGREGVPWLHPSRPRCACQALQEYWEAQRGSQWFEQHPILQHAET